MLFESPINLNLKNAEVTYYPGFFNIKEADNYFSSLLDQIDWKQDTITVYGKTYLQPRLTAFYATNKNNYKYSNIVMQPNICEGVLLEIKNKIETELKTTCTSC